MGPSPVQKNKGGRKPCSCGSGPLPSYGSLPPRSDHRGPSLGTAACSEDTENKPFIAGFIGALCPSFYWLFFSTLCMNYASVVINGIFKDFYTAKKIGILDLEPNDSKC